MRFYNGLPGFDVLDTTFCFVSSFASQKSKALILFQEFVAVLVKLDLMFHYKTWPFRLGYLFQLFSMAFTTWLTVKGEFFHKTKRYICSLKAQVIVSSSEYLLL